MKSATKNKIKKPLGEQIFDAANIVFMVLIILIMAYPMLYVLSISLSSANEVNKGGFFLLPREFTIDAYTIVFKEPGIPRSYLNTVLYTVGGTFFTLLFTSMIAYALSVQDFVFKKFLTVYLTITMFIGGGMIPSYLLMKELHLLDTYWVIVIPGCVGAYNVILFRTFFKGNAMELREAAMIDGASEFRIYLQIVVPPAPPAQFRRRSDQRQGAGQRNGAGGAAQSEVQRQEPANGRDLHRHGADPLRLSLRAEVFRQGHVRRQSQGLITPRLYNRKKLPQKSPCAPPDRIRMGRFFQTINRG